MSQEFEDRWAFSQQELQNPHNTNANDTFTADLFPDDPDQDELEQILVNRRGESLKQFADGSTGVIWDMRDDVDYDSLYNPEQDALADTWRNVTCDQNGKFLRFR